MSEVRQQLDVSIELSVKGSNSALPVEQRLLLPTLTNRLARLYMRRERVGEWNVDESSPVVVRDLTYAQALAAPDPNHPHIGGCVRSITCTGEQLVTG